jgi:tight adherence protein B
MSAGLLLLLLVLATGALALLGWRNSRLRRRSLERIGLQAYDMEETDEGALTQEQARRTYPRRYPYAPAVAGLLVAAAIWFTNLPKTYTVSFGLLIAAIVYLAEMHWADSQIAKMEAQLADAIDLMVASLRAGSALLASLEATLREARQPLRLELEAVVGRIRLGEDPRRVVKDLAARVPLESFRLFSHSLLVHWETGGSLAGSLRTVSRTVRDRLEVSRRINAQAVESQVSVIAVLAIAYGLMLFMLDINPGPMKNLLYSQFGSIVAAVVMVLQAIGMVWIWTMSRIRF